MDVSWWQIVLIVLGAWIGLVVLSKIAARWVTLDLTQSSVALMVAQFESADLSVRFHRSLAVIVPTHWEFRHPTVHHWICTPERHPFAVTISTEYLFISDIDSPEKYVIYAEEFAANHAEGLLIANNITSFSGIPCSDFTLVNKNGTVHRQITLAHHGTEYVIGFDARNQKEFDRLEPLIEKIMGTFYIRSSVLPERSLLDGVATMRLPLITQSQQWIQAWKVVEDTSTSFRCEGALGPTPAYLEHFENQYGGGNIHVLEVGLGRYPASISVRRLAITGAPKLDFNLFDSLFPAGDRRLATAMDGDHATSVSFWETGARGVMAWDVPQADAGVTWGASVLSLPGGLFIGVILDYDGPQEGVDAGFPGDMYVVPFLLETLSSLEVAL